MRHVSNSILCAVLCGGCAQDRVTDDGMAAWAQQRVPVDEQTRAWAIGIADPVAQATLDEFNARADAAELGGPFRLDQYARDVVGFKNATTDSEVAEYLVMYRLTVPVMFFGHPEHFAVFVSKADGSTRVMGGW